MCWRCGHGLHLSSLFLYMSTRISSSSSFSLSLFLCLSCSHSIAQIQTLHKSVGRRHLGSVPLSCTIMAWWWWWCVGFSGDLMFTSLCYRTYRQECLVLLHMRKKKKCSSFCSCLLMLLRVTFFLFSVCLSVSGFPFFPSTSNSTS